MTKRRLDAFLWWIGAPLLIALFTWGPYWIRALMLGRPNWMRIPLVGDAVFDTAAYLQPVGHAVLGIPEAALIGPFASLVTLLAHAFPGASVAEVWLITRWISTVLALWIGAWTVQKWSGVPERSARFMSAMFWVSLVLVLSMKPGVFSWFLPMGLFGLAAVPLVAERLHARKFIHAVLWSLAIAVITSVYAWYQIPIMLWLAVEWFRWFSSRSVRVASVWFGIASLGASAAGIAASLWVTQTDMGRITLQLYERLSLSQTHMPFVSGSVLLTLCWILLLIPVSRRAVGKAGAMAERAVAAWITLLLSFLSSPFTGHYIQNDHYRSAAAICSWLTLALVWNLTRSAEVRPRPPSVATRWLLNILLAVSGVYTLRILAAPYAWNHDLLNIVHLTHWFAFVFTAALIVRWINGKRPVDPMPFAVIIAIATFVIGGVAWAATLTFEFKGMDRVEPLMPLFAWVNTNVPADKTICTDHGGDAYSLDDQLSAVTGRIVLFAHTLLYHRELDVAFLDRMRTVSPYFDIQHSNDAWYWESQSSENQFIVCAQFPQQSRVFRALGMTQEQINHLTGCPQDLIDARWAYVTEAIDHPQPNPEAFQQMCPYVVIPDRVKPLWHLPNGYKETRVMDGVSVWSLK